jgi:hypothetical protein
MRKLIIFFISIISVLSCSTQQKQIDFEISKYAVSTEGLIIEVIIKNSSNSSFWLYSDSSCSLIRQDGNVLYFAPNYFYCIGGWNSTGYFEAIEIREIKPFSNMTYLMSLSDNEKSILDNPDMSAEERDFKRIQFINVTLVFLERNVQSPMSIKEYMNLLIDEGIVVSNMFRVNAKEIK